MPADSSCKFEAFCDSDWGGCLQTRRSLTCYLFKFGNGIVSWKSKKQETVARSSAKAEFRSMASVVAELTWLVGLYKELGITVEVPIHLYCDSKTTIQIAANLIFHERIKHIDIDCHFVREKIVQGMIKTHHVSTKEQQADLLTKSLGRQQHSHLMSKLSLKVIYPPSA